MKERRYGQGPSPRRIYLVAPRHPESFWSMQGTVELFGARTLMPNAALATLMALTPPDVDVVYRHCDENLGEVNLRADCDLVAITGSTLHRERIQKLCAGFASRGVPVALGGTWATAHADDGRELADHLFVGEAELTWPLFLRQWRDGQARPVYHQEGHVDLTASPPPDWSLVEPRRYLQMPVQTSRGCPNRCDFCDVIQYLGRQYRTKTVGQILTELKNISALGSRIVFFSDDNFLGNPAFTRELLQAIIAWNTRLPHPLAFSTQITMQVADDDRLLRQMADARFSLLFLGLESTRRENLQQIGKQHNLARDPLERVRRISRHGIVPLVGFIVGFDQDDPSVFGEIERFLEEAPAPLAGISLLNAPRGTPLFERLQAEGRLVGEDFSGEWHLHTNIIPKSFSPQKLRAEYWRLLRRIYDPQSFERRLIPWLAGVEYFTPLYTNKRIDPGRLRHIVSVLGHLFHAEPHVRRLFLRGLAWGVRHDRRLIQRIVTLLGQFVHFHRFACGPERIRSGSVAGSEPGWGGGGAPGSRAG